MSEKEKQILKTFGEVLPRLSESDKSYLLGLGEGMAYREQTKKEKEEKEELMMK